VLEAKSVFMLEDQKKLLFKFLQKGTDTKIDYVTALIRIAPDLST